MTSPLRLLPRAAGFSLVAASLVACGDDASPAGTGGGTSSSSSSSAGGNTASSSSDTTTGSSTSTGMGTPCTPLKDGVDPNPTPGACDGDVAVTCGQDGFLTSESCTGGATCTEYDLQEWRFADTAVWVEGRTVHWAGCKPPGTEPCTTKWNGNYYSSDEAPHCDGVTRIDCTTPPAPDLFVNSPQLVYGTTEGWRLHDDCGAGTRCAGSDTLGVLTCIPSDTPACDGTEPFCSGQAITGCYGTWESQPGYQVDEPCAPGDQCYEGTSGPFCRAPGEVPCDDATFGPAHCEPDQGSIVACYDGYTGHTSCATCYEDAQSQMVPCRCDDLTSQAGGSWSPDTGYQCNEASVPKCIPQTSLECDPAVDADTCVGNVAHRCVGRWEDLDCGAQGLVCGVSAGLAGCRTANAATCDPSYANHCDGTVMVGCCGCGKGPFLFGPPVQPCVPGYEVRSDCSELGGFYQCDAGTFPFYIIECAP